jgi:MFS family permease
MALPPKWYQFLVGVFASLGSYLYGYDLGVIAEVVASNTFTAKFKPDDTQSGLVVSMFTTGAFFGAAFGGPCGDFLGRRLTIVIGSVIFCLGGALQTGAENIAFLYSGRFLAGLGVGFLVMIIPLYQAELAHPSIRGRITALQQFMLGVGALVASWISWGTYVNIKTSSAQWRVPLGLQIIPAVFLGALIFLFPESPR